jgi:hypothetical protein
VRAAACVFLSQEIEEGGDLEIRGVVVVERFGEIENQVAVQASQAQQALLRSIQLVHHRFVAKLDQTVSNFFLDLLLAQGPHHRRLVGRRSGLVLIDEDTIEEDNNLQFAHFG